MAFTALLDRVTGRRRPGFDQRLIDKLPGSSYLDGGYTNTIVRTDDGTIIKFFRRHPLTAAYYSLFELCFSHRLHYHHRRDRLEQEVSVSRALQGTALTPPTIIYRGNVGVEMAEVPGVSLKEYLGAHGPGTAARMGERLGTVLADLHDDGICLRDCPLQNFRFGDDGTLYSIDHEYATFDPGSDDHHYTIATLLASARHLDHATYTGFRAGFLRTYRPARNDLAPIRLLREVVTGVIAINQGTMREENPQQTKRAAYNSVRDLAATLRSLIPGLTP